MRGQAKLLTSHMLFVGFSFSDDNFYRIADTVKKAREHSRDDEFGTALTLNAAALQQELWRGQLAFVSMARPVARPHAGAAEEVFAAADAVPPRHAPASTAELARQQLIFLDYLGALTGSRRCPILDPRFAAVRTEGQHTLAAALAEMVSKLDAAAKSTPEWGQLASLLEQFGGLEGAAAVCTQCGAPLSEAERRWSRGTCAACYGVYIEAAKRTLGHEVTSGVYDDSPRRSSRAAVQQRRSTSW